MKIACYELTSRQMVALHGLYKGLVKNGKVYGVNVAPQLDKLATGGVIARTGMGYIIPYGSPGEAIIEASRDFTISQHL